MKFASAIATVVVVSVSGSNNNTNCFDPTDCKPNHAGCLADGQCFGHYNGSSDSGAGSCCSCTCHVTGWCPEMGRCGYVSPAEDAMPSVLKSSVAVAALARSSIGSGLTGKYRIKDFHGLCLHESFSVRDCSSDEALVWSFAGDTTLLRSNKDQCIEVHLDARGDWAPSMADCAQNNTAQLWTVTSMNQLSSTLDVCDGSKSTTRGLATKRAGGCCLETNPLPHPSIYVEHCDGPRWNKQQIWSFESVGNTVTPSALV